MLDRDIPDELVIGSEYTGNQLFYFLANKQGKVMILCNSNSDFMNSDTSYRVVEIFEAFIHAKSNVSDNYGRSDTKTKFYKVL